MHVCVCVCLCVFAPLDEAPFFRLFVRSGDVWLLESQEDRVLQNVVRASLAAIERREEQEALCWSVVWLSFKCQGGETHSSIAVKA